METEASTGAWRREESEESRREGRSSTEVAVAAAEQTPLPLPLQVPLLVPFPAPQDVPARLPPSRAERVDESHGGGVMRRESSRVDDDGDWDCDEVDDGDGELGG